MTEAFAGDLWMHTGSKKARCKRVPEIVKADAGQGGFCQQSRAFVCLRQRPPRWRKQSHFSGLIRRIVRTQARGPPAGLAIWGLPRSGRSRAGFLYHATRTGRAYRLFDELCGSGMHHHPASRRPAIFSSSSRPNAVCRVEKFCSRLGSRNADAAASELLRSVSNRAICGSRVPAVGGFRVLRNRNPPASFWIRMNNHGCDRDMRIHRRRSWREETIQSHNNATDVQDRMYPQTCADLSP